MRAQGVAARVGAALLAVAALAEASSAGAATLEDALVAAYQSSPELAQARAALRSLDESVVISRAGKRPSVTGAAAYSGEVSNTGPAGTDTSAPVSLSVTARQTLYDGGRTRNSVESAISSVRAGRADLVAVEQTLLLDTITAYSDVLRDQQLVRLARNDVRVIGEELQAARDRFEVGEATRTDVSQAEAALALSRSNLATQIGALTVSERVFRQVVGVAPVDLQPLPPLPPPPATLDEALAIATQLNPDLASAQFGEEAARREVRAAISELLPSVSLSGSLSYVDTDTTAAAAAEGGSAAVRLEATIPLFQGGAAYAGVRGARARASANLAAIRSTARRIEAETAIAWSDVEVAHAAIDASREGVSAASLALEGVRLEALAGVRTTFDVLDQEQALLDAQTTLATAIRDEYVATARLLQSIGMLTARDLNVPVALYDPGIYYNEAQDRLFGYERDELTAWEKAWSP